MGNAAVADQPPRDSERSHTAFILAIAVVCRVITLLIYLRSGLLPSFAHFGFEDVAIALSIHNGHGYSSPFFVPSGPTALLAPVYPLLIAGVMDLFGLGRSAEVTLLTLNLVLSTLTVLVVVVTARQHFGGRVANLSGFIAAVAPPMLFANLWVWDTCLSALLLSVAVAVAAHLRWKQWQSVGVGVLCAIATLTNPALLPSLLAIFAWSAWRARMIPWLAIVVFLVAFSPWPIRNALTMHAFIPLRTSFDYELWAGNQPGGDGNLRPDSEPMYDRGESQLLVQQGELPYIHAKEVLAIQFISSHPLQFAQLTVKRVFRFWLGSTHSPLPMDAFLPVLGLAGITMLRRRSISTLFMLPLVLFPLPYYITHVEPRYRFVIDPLLAILAGFACESFFAWCARRPAPAATLASVR
jgi:hypothetical protein